MAKRPLDKGRSDGGSGDAGADEERPSRDPVRPRQGRHLLVDDCTGAVRLRSRGRLDVEGEGGRGQLTFRRVLDLAEQAEHAIRRASACIVSMSMISAESTPPPSRQRSRSEAIASRFAWSRIRTARRWSRA